MFDWVRQIAGEAGDDAGGLLLPFGSTSINIGDKNSDIDVVVIVTDDVTVDDFFVDRDGGAAGSRFGVSCSCNSLILLCHRRFLGRHAAVPGHSLSCD